MATTQAAAMPQTTGFVFEGYAGDEQAYASVFIDPSTDPLNDAGKTALAAQTRNRKAAGHDEIPELEVRMYLPYPRDGFSQYVEPAFLAAMKAAWEKWDKAKDVGVTFNLDKFILGQMRIDVNRAATTVKAYKAFTVAGVKNNPKNKKAKKAKIDDGRGYTHAL